MRPRKKVSDDQKRRIEEMMRSSRDVDDFKRIQSVWLRVIFDMSLEEIAEATGLKANTIRMIHSRFLREGELALIGVGRGGRRRQNMTFEEELKFLEQFLEKSRRGEILIVSEIKRSYEEKRGNEVPKSTIYRLLARHGWRKISPRPYHPKGDKAAQEDFKKNSRRSSTKL